jgi:hypothetical protein
MTVPLHDHHMGQTIEEVQLQPTGTWRARHLAMLEQSFAGAPHAADALELAGRVINGNHATLADLARDSMLSLCSYFGLDKTTRFADAGDFAIGGSGSVRVLELVKAVGGTDYITGHGAKNYLDHRMFEAEGISVSYMGLPMHALPAITWRLHSLCVGSGSGGPLRPRRTDKIASQTRDWKEFVNEPQ